MNKRQRVLIGWICMMIFPLNWLRQESAIVRRSLDAAFRAEWVHVVMHLVLFAGLVVLVLLAFRLPQNTKTALLVGALLLIVALAQEMLQLQVKGRSFGGPEWFDLGVDLVGGAIGWWLFPRLPQQERGD